MLRTKFNRAGWVYYFERVFWRLNQSSEKDRPLLHPPTDKSGSGCNFEDPDPQKNLSGVLWPALSGPPGVRETGQWYRGDLYYAAAENQRFPLSTRTCLGIE